MEIDATVSAQARERTSMFLHSYKQIHASKRDTDRSEDGGRILEV